MDFSPYPYIAIVIFVLAVNVWILVRFLKKASRWSKEQPKDDNV